MLPLVFRDFENDGYSEWFDISATCKVISAGSHAKRILKISLSMPKLNCLYISIGALYILHVRTWKIALRHVTANNR